MPERTRRVLFYEHLGLLAARAGGRRRRDVGPRARRDRRDVVARRPGTRQRSRQYRLRGSRQLAPEGLSEAGLTDPVAYDTALPPWQESALREAERVTGKDYGREGLAASRHGIGAFARYSVEQGIAARLMGDAEIFPHG